MSSNQLKDTMEFDDFIEYATSAESPFFIDFTDFLSFRSMSTVTPDKSDIGETVGWLTNKLKEYGFTKVQTAMPEGKAAFVDGFPSIIADYVVSKDLPTILVYSHYDVQPADEPNWQTQPFKPTLKDGRIYARGASDTKGRFWASLMALYYYINYVPDSQKHFNIRLFIEGEEEIGSGNTVALMKQRPDLFATEYLFLNDMSQFNSDTPTVVYSLRGIVYYHLSITTGKKALHSGSYGNLAINAPQLLSYVIYKLKDIWRNSIRIEKLKKRVRKPSKQEIEQLAKLSPSWEDVKKTTGTFYTTKYKGGKEDQFLPLHLIGLFPSLDVHGIWSGYTHPGVKTIIPYKADSVFSLRIVAHLTPDYTTKVVNDYIAKLLHKFKGVEYSLTQILGFGPFFEDPNAPELQLLQRITSDVYGKPAVMMPIGSSVGVLSTYKELYPQSRVMIHALGKPEDNVHAANESFSIDQIQKGAYILHKLLAQLGWGC